MDEPLQEEAQPGRQLWLELPPISTDAPRRLIVFLHPAGSSPELLAPVAIAWQLKFPGATAILLEGMARSAVDPSRRDWFDPRTDDRARDADHAATEAASRIESLQRQLGLDGRDTFLVGFSQGATIALELSRLRPALASVVVAYAARLSRPIRHDDRFSATIHLIHGEFDSIVPLPHAQQAFRGMKAAGADVTLDVAEGLAHGIDQEMVNLGTWRVMRTLFRGRTRRRQPTLH